MSSALFPYFRDAGGAPRTVRCPEQYTGDLRDDTGEEGWWESSIKDPMRQAQLTFTNSAPSSRDEFARRVRETRPVIC